MTTSKTHYELHSNVGLGFFKLKDFTTIEEARSYAHSLKSRTEEFYKIVSVTVSTFDLPTFSLPAYIPSVEEVAKDIIGFADGSFQIDWGEDFENLSEADQRQVEDMVNEEIASCDGCGWHWHVDGMEHFDSGDSLCWKCAEDRHNEEEEEEDED